MKLLERLSLIVVAAAVLFLVSVPGYCFSVSIFGVPNLAQPVDGAGTYSRGLGYGGGLMLDSITKPYSILEFQRVFYFSYEFSFMHLVRNYTATVSTVTYYFTTPEEQMQFLVRAWISPLLSIGAGGYASYNPGKIEYSSVEGSNSSDPTNRIDYGVAFSIRFGFHLGFTQLFMDARYASGFANQVSDGQAHYDNYMLLIGFRFGKTPFYDLNANMMRDYGRHSGSPNIYY